MTHIITEPCVGVKDTACVDFCPVHAIFPQEETPDKWKTFIAKNYEHFGLSPP